MLNDPLIPTPPITAEVFPGTTKNEGQTRARAVRVPQRTPRAKHPALSARILATGLAATGMFGMTAGYALGQRAEEASPAAGSGVAPPAVAPQAPATAGALPAQAPEQKAPQQKAPQQASPAPRVVQVPVDVPAAAAPGNGAGSGNWAPAPTQQQSNGSN